MTDEDLMQIEQRRDPADIARIVAELRHVRACMRRLVWRLEKRHRHLQIVSAEASGDLTLALAANVPETRAAAWSSPRLEYHDADIDW